jgi:mono/diheme cytochrome c family protein
MPRWIPWTALALLLLSWIPFALIAKSRVMKSDRPGIHLVPDMDDQPKYEPQEGNVVFADRRGMRPVVDGTVARGELDVGGPAATGRVGEGWVTAIPVPVDETTMRNGRDRFDTFCAPCHGVDGSGNGIVNERANRLAEGSWTPPTDLRTDLVRDREDGHLYNTITHGIRNMPAYGPQIPAEERWAIVAYLRALQRSQRATIDDVPEELRETLR